METATNLEYNRKSHLSAFSSLHFWIRFGSRDCTRLDDNAIHVDAHCAAHFLSNFETPVSSYDSTRSM